MGIPYTHSTAIVLSLTQAPGVYDVLLLVVIVLGTAAGAY